MVAPCVHDARHLPRGRYFVQLAPGILLCCGGSTPIVGLILKKIKS
ncbi:hypothetical protein CORMATOL_02715 [Corynebacterium matruchotii ATCC 33806]|uniref:Uncharacterized protein n=1 Tax=Corynebacterium matruchotii ATCC 33806 TaxID=566549 RepID=C0E6S8_9CORY|nr:hypothetical protein CORMATOL_02715 [Corynebacterium matruchotii ATCC 33806]